MAGVFMARYASVLRGIGSVQHSRVRFFRSGAAGPGEQVIVAIQAAPAWYMVQYFCTGLFDVIFFAKIMFVSVLGTGIRFGGYIAKVFILWREMAIDAFNSETVLIGAVIGKLPRPVGGVHFVTFGAAVTGQRYGLHHFFKNDETEYGKNKPQKQSRQIFFNDSKYPSDYFNIKHNPPLFLLSSVAPDLFKDFFSAGSQQFFSKLLGTGSGLVEASGF